VNAQARSNASCGKAKGANCTHSNDREPACWQVRAFSDLALHFNDIDGRKLLDGLTKRTTHGVITTYLNTLSNPLAHIQMSPGAQRITSEPNAGGNSLVSEALSFEVLHRMLGAGLLATEMEVRYWPEVGPMTDYLACIMGRTFGVSVTRAFAFRRKFTLEDGVKLLCRKLTGIQNATYRINNMLPDEQPLFKQVLHVWARNGREAAVVRRAYQRGVPQDLQAGSIVLITVAGGVSQVFDN